MLPPGATETIEHFKSSLYYFAAVTVAGTICALLFAQIFGKSQAQRQLIFSIVSVAGLCIAAYVSVSKLGA